MSHKGSTGIGNRISMLVGLECKRHGDKQACGIEPRALSSKVSVIDQI